MEIQAFVSKPFYYVYIHAHTSNTTYISHDTVHESCARTSLQILHHVVTLLVEQTQCAMTLQLATRAFVVTAMNLRPIFEIANKVMNVLDSLRPVTPRPSALIPWVAFSAPATPVTLGMGSHALCTVS